MGKIWRGKPGERYPNGRRKKSRAEVEAEEAENRAGNLGVRRRRLHLRFGARERLEGANDGIARDETADAIGRLYVAAPHLMGDNARKLLGDARRVHGLYWSVYGGAGRSAPGRPHCCLASLSGGYHGAAGSEDEQAERDAERARELATVLKRVSKRGRQVRAAFDQLVIEPHPDHGPLWLDNILAELGKRGTARAGDWQTLMLAVRGLEAVGA